MPAIEIRTEAKQKPPLGRSDWLAMALKLFISDGVDAVQITQLAKALSVTRGSFYWHFKSRDGLLSAMLMEWQAANNEFFNQMLKSCETLDEAVLIFFEIWVGTERFSPELDQSVRDWARLDNSVLELVRKEDNKRLSDIANVFCRNGFSPDEADVRARVLYFSQVGYTAINLGEALNERLSLLERYYQAYTGRKLDPTIASQFAHKMQNMI